MSAKIVRMPPPVVLTDEDLEIAEGACCGNAARCRRQGAIDDAAHWQRVSDNIARVMENRNPGWSHWRATTTTPH